MVAALTQSAQGESSANISVVWQMLQTRLLQRNAQTVSVTLIDIVKLSTLQYVLESFAKVMISASQSDALIAFVPSRTLTSTHALKMLKLPAENVTECSAMTMRTFNAKMVHAMTNLMIPTISWHTATITASGSLFCAQSLEVYFCLSPQLSHL